MRIVAGEFGGRPLATPSSRAIRPTSDRLRQTLFDVLAHSYDDPISGARVLDLFAGTGALGIEALSRGAVYALFVEEDIEARSLIRSNIEALRLTGRTRLFRRDATALGPAGPIAPFDVVFADPPYGAGLGEKALASAIAGGWLKLGALCVLEESTRANIAPIVGLGLVETRTIGDSALSFYRVTAPATG